MFNENIGSMACERPHFQRMIAVEPGKPEVISPNLFDQNERALSKKFVLAGNSPARSAEDRPVGLIADQLQPQRTEPTVAH